MTDSANNGLLGGIRDALQNNDVTAAQTELRSIADSAQDAGSKDAAALANMMSNLLDLIGCFDDTDGNRVAEVRDAVGASLEVLPQALEQKTCKAAKRMIESTQDQWGEYLDLVAGSDQPKDNWDTQWSDTNDNETDLADDFDASNVDMAALLAGLAGAETASPEPTPGKPAAAPATSTNTTASIPEPPAPEQPVIDAEILEAYTDDATSCLASMEECLLTIEHNPTSVESMQQFCRELHTLKGASGSVGLSRLAGYLHKVEDYVEATYKKGGSLEIDPVLRGVDAVRAQLALMSGGSIPDAAPVHTPQVSKATGPSEPVSRPKAQSDNAESSYVRVEAGRLSTLLDLLAELVSLRNRRDTYVGGLRDLHTGVAGCVSRMRTLTEKLSDVGSSSETEAENFARSASRHATYRARELAELCSDLAELNRSLREVFDPLGSDNVSVSRLIGEFRRELMDLQRVPVAGLFRRLHRPARDAARLEEKQVEVDFVGSEVRLERALQERLFEPLLHIVRNAVSHGIEHPDGREQCGKDQSGRVTLRARSNATSLVFEVQDDGRGLDYERLEQKGRERGLIPAGASPSRDRLARLIFHPGFSTQTEVSEVSGRGVGMDVVATQVHRMRGRVEIDSETGSGTTIRLQIPLRSAIEHAMVVRCGGQLFAVPMQFVQAARPEPGDLPQDMKVVGLQQLLGLEAAADSNDPQLIVLGQETSGEKTNRVAIEVDGVVGAEEVVVRAVPQMLISHPMLAGLTLSGHGETVQILDVSQLIQMAENGTTATATARTKAPVEKKTRARVLVVDDSLSTRRTHVRMVQQAGFETAEASDGLEALNMLKSEQFDAVLTDLEMPRLGGFELVSEIKQRSRINDIPVIVITSRGDEETHKRLLSLGANQVVVKPLTNLVFADLHNMLQDSASPSEPVTAG